MTTITIKDLGFNWYCFTNVPQEGRYIKIDSLQQSTPRKALNTAKKLNPNYQYKIEKE